MIDHVGIRIKDGEKSRAFYKKALAPLGYTEQMLVPKEYTDGKVVAGYGSSPKPDFWISEDDKTFMPTHVAFEAKSKEEVDAFYKAALAAGGKDNGAPGPRPHYHQHYYGAFVYDLDGHNIEAVFHHAQ